MSSTSRTWPSQSWEVGTQPRSPHRGRDAKTMSHHCLLPKVHTGYINSKLESRAELWFKPSLSNRGYRGPEPPLNNQIYIVFFFSDISGQHLVEFIDVCVYFFTTRGLQLQKFGDLSIILVFLLHPMLNPLHF